MRSAVIDLRIAIPVAVAWFSLALVIGMSGQHLTPQLDVDVTGIAILLRPMTDVLTQLRETFVAEIALWPAPGNELVAGLAVGDTSLVTMELEQAMRQSSLTHLTAVSGANCAIVTGMILRVSAALAFPRWMRTATATSVLILFVMLVTPQPSVLRAAAMGVVVLIASARGERWGSVAVLSTATYLLLLFVPAFAVSAGFCLSVAATAGLLLLARPLEKALRRWLPGWLAAMLAIPFAAQLACQPILILLTPQWQTYGVAANLLVEPVIATATVASLCAVLLVPLSPILAWPFLALAWCSSQWVAAVAFAIERLPFANISWLGGWPGFFCAAAVSVVIVISLVSPRRFVRHSAGILVLFGLGTVVLSTVAISVTVWATQPRLWNVYMCDVGQGDAVLVAGADKSGERQIALIDTGRDIGLLKKCLADSGTTHLDLLVLTHYDQDHVGAAVAVLDKVDDAIVPIPENADDERLLAQLAEKGATLHHGWAGVSGELGQWKYRVLWPMNGFPDFAAGNPGSISMLFSTEEISLLTLGDQNEASQAAFISKYPRLSNIDIVKVAHHGSGDQSTTAYEMWKPRLALVSAGANNGYGHPTSRTLDLLSDVGAVIERTDQEGAVAVTINGEELAIWRERGG